MSMSGHAPYSHMDETERAYQDLLNESIVLHGWDGLRSSELLKRGDPIAYEQGLADYRDQQESQQCRS